MVNNPLQLLAYSAHQLYYALGEGGTLTSAGLYQEINTPRPGDLVLEISSIKMAEEKNDWSFHIGRIVLARYEKTPEGGEEMFYYIESIVDKTLKKWHGCKLIKILERRDNHVPYPPKTDGDERDKWIERAISRHGLRVKL